MKVLGKLMTHVRLVARMAKSTDTDLVEAHQSGELSQQEWADMVQTCRRCAWAEGCGEWLDSHEAVDCAPGTCLNREKFAVLRAKAENRTGQKESEVA